MRSFALLILLCAAVACADEGMWLFNDFPAASVKQAYGFAPDAVPREDERAGTER